jgi:arylsulfatase A-like enzyme
MRPHTRRWVNRSSGLLLITLLFTAGGCTTFAPQAAPTGAAKPPNIIIILADDMGYTDLGAFGGEIATPNLDRLANAGIRLSNFHMLPTCQPSRAMLLTGADHHIAGMGSQDGLLTDAQKSQPGYEMRLTDRVESVVAQLQRSGYQTFMSGKWHLGEGREDWPDRRGFDHYFSLLQGGGSHLDASGITPRSPQSTFVEDGEVTTIPADFYSSDYFTSKLLGFLESQRDPQKPYFAYLSFIAPHWPLQAPEADLGKYRGRYDAGYDALRHQRIAGAQAAGLLEAATDAITPVPGLAAWQDLNAEQQADSARRMEIYAAMVERLDWNIGRLLEFLQQSGQADNTIIVFASDNGAEGHDMENYPSLRAWIAENYDNRLANVGRTGSYAATGPGWAQASMGPFRLYKGYMSEGGTRVPAIVYFPGETQVGRMLDGYASVADIAPTLLDWAGATGQQHAAVRGRSMQGWLSGQQPELYGADESIAWELFGRRAVYRGDWKLLWMEQPWGSGAWQLFDLRNDPGELHDLAAEYPEVRDALVQDWEDYARENGVILPERQLPY